jgi:hypothetical protein
MRLPPWLWRPLAAGWRPAPPAPPAPPRRHRIPLAGRCERDGKHAARMPPECRMVPSLSGQRACLDSDAPSAPRRSPSVAGRQLAHPKYMCYSSISGGGIRRAASRAQTDATTASTRPMATATTIRRATLAHDSYEFDIWPAGQLAVWPARAPVLAFMMIITTGPIRRAGRHRRYTNTSRISQPPPTNPTYSSSTSPLARDGVRARSVNIHLTRVTKTTPTNQLCLCQRILVRSGRRFARQTMLIRGEN